MKLIYNENRRRFEFHYGKTEKDNEGALAMRLAQLNGFKVVGYNADSVVAVTVDPAKALGLGKYATPALVTEIQKAIKILGVQIPVMTFINGCYIWSGPKMNLDGTVKYFEIPKAAGFAFARRPEELPRNAGVGFARDVWWTEKHVKAELCAEYADELAAIALGQAMAKRHSVLASSRAMDADIEVLCPEGLTPRGYQKAFVAYCRPRIKVLGGDEMGLGKTIETVLWINDRPDVKRVLVLCPASLKLNWKRELEKWLVRPATIGIADGKLAQAVPDTDIVIINYQMLHKRIDTGRRTMRKDGTIKIIYDYVLRDSLRGVWDMLVVDECHRLKGDPRDVIQVRMAFEIQARLDCWLSGTPLVNKVRDLWNLVHRLAPKTFPNQHEYLERYCKGGKNFRDKYSGAQNLAELQQKLRLSCMIRRLKRDVLSELPAKLRQIIELPADGATALIQQELAAFERKEQIFGSMRLRVELAKASESFDDYKRAVENLKQGIKVAFEELSRIRRETAVAKIPAVIDHIENVLEEGHKVVLFAHHREVVEAYHAKFKDVARFMHGGTKLPDRQRAVDDFQGDDKVRLIVGSFGAMGVGWTLTAAAYCALAEQDWVPGVVVQSEDRLHRIGQVDSVLIQHLVLEKSLDKRMADVLVEKQGIADAALDRESADILLNEPITPEREQIATSGVTPQQIERLAEDMTATDIATVSMCLRLLAGTHADSAIMEGQTFREVDRALGQILADNPKLTPRLAALGKKFLTRYKTTNLAMLPEFQHMFKEKS